MCIVILLCTILLPSGDSFSVVTSATVQCSGTKAASVAHDPIHQHKEVLLNNMESSRKKSTAQH
jgi:hypothetical protein